MQVLELHTEQPEAGTDVTRLWLGPGSARLAVMFGNTVQFNGSVLCWDTAAGRALWYAPLQDSDDTYLDPDFDRDLTRVVYSLAPEENEELEGAADHYVAVRELPDGPTRRLAGQFAYLPAITADGRYALALALDARSRRGLRRWAVPADPGADTGPLTPDPRWRIDLPPPTGVVRQMNSAPRALATSPDGARVALGRADGSITVWAWSNRREVLSVPALKGLKYVRFGIHRLVFSPDGAMLAAVRGRWANRRYGYQVHVWSLATGAQLRGPTEKANVSGVAFSPDGRTLLTAREDGTVGEWDAATWKLRRAFEWKVGKLFSVCFAPDGLTCAAGGADGRVVIWDAE